MDARERAQGSSGLTASLYSVGDVVPIYPCPIKCAKPHRSSTGHFVSLLVRANDHLAPGSNPGERTNDCAHDPERKFASPWRRRRRVYVACRWTVAGRLRTTTVVLLDRPGFVGCGGEVVGAKCEVGDRSEGDQSSPCHHGSGGLPSGQCGIPLLAVLGVPISGEV